MRENSRKLSEDEITAALEELDGWELKEGKKFHKLFKFDSFVRAMGWMSAVAIEADKLDHHPNWCNTYNKVEVDLWTHAIDALSASDLALARKMDALA